MIQRFCSGRALAAAGFLALAACAARAPAPKLEAPAAPLTIDKVVDQAAAPPLAPVAPAVETPITPSPLSVLPGWSDESGTGALTAVLSACDANLKLSAQKALWEKPCAALRALPSDDAAGVKAMIERRFTAEAVPGEGLMTGYFAPVYPAKTEADATYSAPLRPRPDDLLMVDGDKLSPSLRGRKAGAKRVGGRYEPYDARAEIDARPPEGSLFLRPEDLFFLQIQGSGVLILPDGRRLRAVYAADNGRPFVPIARPLIEQGALKPGEASADAIRSWLRDHAGPEAQSVMNLNPRYVFFTVTPDQGAGSVGAAGLSLPPGRSGAIDPAYTPYGALLWVDADAGSLSNAFPAYHRLVAALDTGGAIKGRVRLDLFFGEGDAAGKEAGRVKHRLHLWRIIPRAEP